MILLQCTIDGGGVTSEPKERKIDLARSPSSFSRVFAEGFFIVLLPLLEEDDDEDPKRLKAAKEVPKLAPYPCCEEKQTTGLPAYSDPG